MALIAGTKVGNRGIRPGGSAGLWDYLPSG
jgi:hypothetical protein